MSSVRGKVALITGGSSGIGRAAGMRLAKMGAHIVLAARSSEPLQKSVDEIRAVGGKALGVTTDVTDESQCGRAVEAAIAHFGQLDLLICSAGVSMHGDFVASDLSALEQVMNVNF